MTTQTHGLVCAHHHLYSSLARGMPAGGAAADFLAILKTIWWRLDIALDLDIIYWSAALGAAEAVMSGTTAIIDHHESPTAIEGSLDAIADGCALVGVRTNLCYGVTDRWSDDQSLMPVGTTPRSMTDGARRGLQECDRYLSTGATGMVGVHAAFTCSDETLEAAADLALRHNTGVHIHVAEGDADADASMRLQSLASESWLLAHCVYLEQDMPGTIVHNARSNMNNAVGYAYPAKKNNRIVLGTDGIGADMQEEARLAYARLRESDISQTPETVWQWLQNAEQIFPEVCRDTVTWNYGSIDSPWHSAFTTTSAVSDVAIGGVPVVVDSQLVTCDLGEIRAKAAEATQRLFGRL